MPIPDPKIVRRGTWLSAAAAALTAAGCAGASRGAAVRKALDGHEYRQDLDAVWPAALRLLTDRKFDLVGRDRDLAGQPAQSGWGHLLNKGRETRAASGGRWVAETDFNDSELRYRVEGWSTGAGRCRIVYTAITAKDYGAREEETRDLEMELDLVDRLEPAEAERIRGAGQP